MAPCATSRARLSAGSLAAAESRASALLIAPERPAPVLSHGQAQDRARFDRMTHRIVRTSRSGHARRRRVAAAALLALQALASCVGTRDQSASVPLPPRATAGWTRAFTDDFAAARLDDAKWGRYTGQPGGDPGGR